MFRTRRGMTRRDAIPMRKIVTAAVLIPLAIIIAMFAVANRGIVTVTFDPFSTTNPAFALTMPMFILIFVLVGIGVLVGGIAAWLKQHKWRVRARRAEAEARELRARLDTQRLHRSVPARLDTAPPIAIPPAA